MKNSIIRVAPEDLSLTREPAMAFFRESCIDGALDFDHFCATWGQWIQLDMADILLYCDNSEQHAKGIIGGLLTQCSMTGDMIATEAFWWVAPELRGGTAGIRLLNTWETLVQSQGAKRTYVGNLIGLNNEKMHDIYTRLGYKPLETHYVKSNDI